MIWLGFKVMSWFIVGIMVVTAFFISLYVLETILLGIAMGLRKCLTPNAVKKIPFLLKRVEDWLAVFIVISILTVLGKAFLTSIGI